MKLKISLAHVAGLGLGVFGWMLAVQALPQLPSPVSIFLFSLYWMLVITVQGLAAQKLFPLLSGDGKSEWHVNLQFVRLLLTLVIVATPLCLTWEWTKSLPLNKILIVAICAIYWVVLGELAKNKVAEISLSLPSWWRWIRTRVFFLEDQTVISLAALLKWGNANLFLGILVFTGIRKALERGVFFSNGVGITLVLVATYIFSTFLIVLYGRVRQGLYQEGWFGLEKVPHWVLSPMELVQMFFALTQKWAVIWMVLLGETGAAICGLILGFESPLCNIVRIAAALVAIWLMNGFPPSLTPAEKRKARVDKVKRLFINGPMAGLLAGVLIFLGGRWIAPIPHGVLLGIDQFGYPFVPCTLFLVGAVGQLNEVLAARLSKQKNGGKQDYTMPFLYVLVMSLGVVPVFAHVVCGWFYSVGMMDHVIALELARFLSHGCSITAWGILILMWKAEDARLYLLFFLVTTAGSVFSIPLIYGYCAF